MSVLCCDIGVSLRDSASESSILAVIIAYRGCGDDQVLGQP
jgi:hypothetical protein